LRKEDIRIKILRIAIFLGLLTWCFGFSGFLLSHDSPLSIISYPVFKQLYSNVCHQNEFKIFDDVGFNIFICARCTGIYLGALFISFLSVFIRLRIVGSISWLYIALILILADVLFVSAGIYEYSKLISIITGLYLGFVICIYFLEIIENSIGKILVVKNNV
jgi:uncharacterized membrane protein